jgi:hypothetical protein
MAGSNEAKVLLGEAAEHLVLARLLRRGYVASQAPRAWKADDILVQGGPRIQVKATVRGKKAGWMVGNVGVDKERFYAFVDFSDEALPVVYVLPSTTVRDAAESYDNTYHQVHPSAKQGDIRKVEDPMKVPVDGYPPGWLEEYREGWHAIPQG